MEEEVVDVGSEEAIDGKRLIRGLN